MRTYMYFDKEYSEQELVNMGLPEQYLVALGAVPIVENFPTYDVNLQQIVPQLLELKDGVYSRVWIAENLSVPALADGLSRVREPVLRCFHAAFTEIDAKTRPMRGALLSVVDGTFPTQAYNADEPPKDLTPEQQQRIVDVGIMWELEEVAQVNRDMQTELLALEITEDMTLEQAQEITLRIASAKPWLPWREAQKP